MAKVVYGRRKNWFGPQNLVLLHGYFFLPRVGQTVGQGATLEGVKVSSETSLSSCKFNLEGCVYTTSFEEPTYF